MAQEHKTMTGKQKKFMPIKRKNDAKNAKKRKPKLLQIMLEC